MITDTEVQELQKRGKEDGALLFKIASKTQNALITTNLIIAALGTVATIYLFGIQATGGYITLPATVIVCTILHVTTLLITQTSKVLVHILFSNLALINK